MDPFERFRKAAIELHSEIVAEGGDPLKPEKMVDQAIKKLDLVLGLLTPGDPALKGAKALFDEQSGTICCEKSGTSTDRILLIAHEIAHACVHSRSSTCSTEDIDPTRSTETVPVGLQRVEDYGARERRELQADIFAREFLLPRTIARQLHIESGLSASAIADQLTLPKNLVRQQLLDALLLPPSDPMIKEDVTVQPLHKDPSQDRAAAHSGSAFQLQAGPGTGKTKTLVKRVLRLISEGIDPASILVLTFSNRAAGELVERFADSGPDSTAQIWVGTFHAFGLDLIRRHHEKLDLPADPTLFDRSDAITMLEEILPMLQLVHYRNLWDPVLVLRDILTAISRAKDEMADPERYRELSELMLKYARNEEDKKAAEKCLEIAQIYDIYEKVKHERSAVDFGDLVMIPALLLESDTAVRSSVQLRHRHVVVDEYQDVNHASTRLLRAIAGEGRRLWVVGDSRQSIYRFRGASSSNMTAFLRDYPEAVADQLSINYRSTEQIVNVFSSFSPHMGSSNGMLPLSLYSSRGQGLASPEIRRFDTLDQEIEGIAASIRELEVSGVRLRDQAVLCRTNGRMNQIAAALEHRGIPVLHLGSLFERDEVRNLLSLLSLAVDSFGRGLINVGTMPRYNMSMQDVYIAIQQLKTAETPVLSKLTALTLLPGVSADGAAGLMRLANDLTGLSTTSSAWEFLTTYLLDNSGLVREIAKAETIADRLRAIAIWQFLNFVRNLGPIGQGLPIQRLLDRVRQLVLLSEERDLRQVPSAALHMEAVRLLTVHGSKGLEFEAVHIPGLTVLSFPSANRGQRCPPPVGLIVGAENSTVSEESKREHEHEEECLFFVAMSRARTHLRIYLSRFQRNGNKRSPSPFLNNIPQDMLWEIEDPPTLQLPEDKVRISAIPVTMPSDWHVTDSRLNSYDGCPLRFFYTHVIGIGGARKATAFSRTHDCLYEFIRWLSAIRQTDNPSIVDAEQEFERIWKVRGPNDHAFADDYRRLASRLLNTLVLNGEGYQFYESEQLAVDFANGRIIVEPNEIATLPDGTIVLRRIHTGYKRTCEYDRLEYTLYHLAGQMHYGEKFLVEAHHLTDEIIEQVNITSQKIRNRRTKTDKMLANIAQGRFPAKVDIVSCPRCPHFFICNSVPVGPLTLT